MSKIREKTIHNQTQEYSDKSGLLYKYQSGFRAHFSTESCFVRLTDFILRKKDKVFDTVMILFDLQKALDTLGRTVLLQKMECIDFKALAIKWFQSYLSFLWH